MALRLKLKRLLNLRNSPLKQSEILSFLTKYQALAFSRPLHLLLRLGTSVFSTLLKPSRHSLVLIPRSISPVNSMGIETRSLNEVHGLVEEFSLQSPWPPLEEQEMARRSTPVSYTHLRAHETRHDLVCRLLLEKKKKKKTKNLKALYH